ncbi:MAG: SRPBCC domain-containing protein [Actinomycetia bacterium]|nr:SRPBCC domain-containing protein [Actinomycetes bacterium]
MLHHVSFTAKNPKRVAEVIATLINGRVSRFGPWDGGFIAWAPDQAGTAIEIYPHGTEMVPGDGNGQARFQRNLFAAKATATHAALSVDLTAEQVFGIVQAQGWQATVQDRGGFNIIEAWIEDTVMLEIMTPAMVRQYLAVVKSPQVQIGGPETGTLTFRQDVDTSVGALFQAWTDSAALQQWWSVPEATIDLCVGGAYELIFSPDGPLGARGSEACKILSYVPDRFLSFTWNTPAHLGLGAAQTWVVIEFSSSETGATLNLTHCGFGEGPDWERAKTYFAQAWRRVLRRLAAHWTEKEVDLRTAKPEQVRPMPPMQREPRELASVVSRPPMPSEYAGS